MSVFQLQEWWAAKISENEEFDHGGLVIGNVDNSNPASDKICVGSLQGTLRIYAPTKPQFRVEDLILEEVLEAPILQLLIGRFIPSTDINGLAVLHPRQLVVYELNPQGNKDGRVNYYSLRKAYSHDLGMDGKHFTAYNMTMGAFGGVRGREMFVVQSMDGKLQIFEQSANAFTRQLSDCLIPGPLAYLPKLDGFITVNHACQVECYRYQVLASSQSDGAKAGDSKESGSFGLRSIRSAMVEWSINLGETCRQVVQGYFSNTEAESKHNSSGPRSHYSAPSELLMVCEKSLFLLKGESGGIIQQRKLERSDAACACMVPCTGPNGGAGNNFIVALQDSTMQVYSSFNLVWAAKLLQVPVQMGVATFGNQKGLVVTLSDSGHLAINYLGTRPPVTAIMTQARELNYDKVDEEHRALLQVIRESQTESQLEPVDKLLIRAQMPKTLDLEHLSQVDLPDSLVSLYNTLGTVHGESNYVKVSVRLFLTYSADKPATNVSVVVSAPPNIHVVPHNFLLNKVSGIKTTPIMVTAHFYAKKSHLPSGLNATVTATYLSFKGDPRVASMSLRLPLSLSCRPKVPQKSAACKIVLDTQQYPAQPLTELFGDFLYCYQESGLDVSELLGNNAIQAMGFQLFTSLSPAARANVKYEKGSPRSISSQQLSSVVSILVSKNAGRYRIQADSYPALFQILMELENRLIAKLAPQTLPPDQISGPIKNQPPTVDVPSIVKFADNLPIEEYIYTINEHFQTRLKILEFNSKLNDAAYQFRIIQKRLLVRFKDKNPTALGGLEILMTETYNKIILLGDEIEKNQELLRQQQNDLDCFSKLIAYLAAMKYGLTNSERVLLQSYLCPELQGGNDQGWEETVNAAITHLLRTSLAKNVKESATLTNVTLEMPNSIDSLKKHLLVLVDRLDKGGRLIVQTSGK